jgi:O-antigen/teichoic acid export membrane protein
MAWGSTRNPTGQAQGNSVGAMTEAAAAPIGPGFARRVLAFAGLPFLSLITPFLFLPILARVAGAEAWVAIAVGQSIGAFFALAVSLGYNTVGPALVALTPADGRAAVLLASVRARCAVLVPASIVSVTVAALVVPPGYGLVGGLMALATVLAGLSSSWYMIGLGRAGLIAVFEILPRIAATVAAAVLLVLGASVLWYPLLLLAASATSVVGFVVYTAGWRGLGARGDATVKQVLASNRSAVATELAAGAYNSLAVTFVGITATTAQAASYVAGDKLYRIGQYSVSALGNAVQGWVVEDDRAHFTARARRSLLMHAALGAAGVLGFALLGPWLSAALFGADNAIDELTALGFGVATLGVALGTSLGRVTLVGLGARRQFMISVFIAATVGIPSVLALSSMFGAAGGAWGLALGELASVTAQSLFLRAVWRRLP